MLKVDPLLVKESLKAFKTPIIWFQDQLSKWTDDATAIRATLAVNKDILLPQVSAHLNTLLQGFLNNWRPIRFHVLRVKVFIRDRSCFLPNHLKRSRNFDFRAQVVEMPFDELVDFLAFISLLWGIDIILPCWVNHESFLGGHSFLEKKNIIC